MKLTDFLFLAAAGATGGLLILLIAMGFVSGQSAICGTEPAGVCARNWFTAFGTALAGSAILVAIIEGARSRRRDREEMHRFEEVQRKRDDYLNESQRQFGHNLYLYTLPMRSQLAAAHRILLPKIRLVHRMGFEGFQNVAILPPVSFATEDHARIGMAVAGLREILKCKELWDPLFNIDEGRLREPHQDLMTAVGNFERRARVPRSNEDLPALVAGQSFAPPGWGTPDDISSTKWILQRAEDLANELDTLHRRLFL